jgi:hypothetical protein
MHTASRGNRPINDRFVKKMGYPLLSGSKVPVGATPQFITGPVALNETSCAEAGDQTLLGCVGGPCFPSIHSAKMNEGVRQKLSTPESVFCQRHGFGI